MYDDNYQQMSEENLSVGQNDFCQGFPQNIEDMNVIDESIENIRGANEDVIPRQSTRYKKAVNMDDFITYFTADSDFNDPMTVEEAPQSPEKCFWKEEPGV
ncbi:hypothetical protein JTB14_002356 [Gonioctena quinquepunctata]|nr:hypothetical protein JTB14_002356 [Gonioctena quinquepunctata]